MFVVGNLFGQEIIKNHLSLFGGATFPTGDFSALSGNTAGFAKTGFGGGLEFTARVLEGLQVGALGEFSVNSTDEEFLRKYFSSVPVGISSGSWFLFGGMASVGYIVDVSPVFGLYGRGYLGLCVGGSPEFSINLPSSSGGMVKQNSATSSSFGYGVGAGVVISNLVDVGVH